MKIIVRKRKWTEQQLKDAVKASTSFRQVISLLKLRPAGGNYDQIKKYVKELGVDISHFKGQAWNKGLTGLGKPVHSLKEILQRNSIYQSFKLKNRLFKAGLKPQMCEECGWSKKTESGFLPLELHHINGDRHDNRLKNLTILCPNCHSLKANHRGRGGRKFN